MGEVLSLAAARTRRTSDEKLLKKRDMAAEIGVSTRTLDRYVASGLIQPESWTLMRVSHTGATQRRYFRSRVLADLGLPTG